MKKFMTIFFIILGIILTICYCAAMYGIIGKPTNEFYQTLAVIGSCYILGIFLIIQIIRKIN